MNEMLLMITRCLCAFSDKWHRFSKKYMHLLCFASFACEILDRTDVVESIGNVFVHTLYLNRMQSLFKKLQYSNDSQGISSD